MTQWPKLFADDPFVRDCWSLIYFGPRQGIEGKKYTCGRRGRPHFWLRDTENYALTPWVFTFLCLHWKEKSFLEFCALWHYSVFTYFKPFITGFRIQSHNRSFTPFFFAYCRANTDISKFIITLYKGVLKWIHAADYLGATKNKKKVINMQRSCWIYYQSIWMHAFAELLCPSSFSSTVIRCFSRWSTTPHNENGYPRKASFNIVHPWTFKGYDISGEEILKLTGSLITWPSSMHLSDILKLVIREWMF